MILPRFVILDTVIGQTTHIKIIFLGSCPYFFCCIYQFCHLYHCCCCPISIVIVNFIIIVILFITFIAFIDFIIAISFIAVITFITFMVFIITSTSLFALAQFRLVKNMKPENEKSLQECQISKEIRTVSITV